MIFARFLILFFLVEMNWRSIGTHGAKKHSLKHVDETSQFSYQVFIIFAIRSFVSCYYFYYYHHDLQKLGANYYLVCNQFFLVIWSWLFFLCFLFEVGYSTCHWWVCDIFLSFSGPKCLSKTWMNNWLIVWCLSFDGCKVSCYEGGVFWGCRGRWIVEWFVCQCEGLFKSWLPALVVVGTIHLSLNYQLLLMVLLITLTCQIAAGG